MPSTNRLLRFHLAEFNMQKDVLYMSLFHGLMSSENCPHSLVPFSNTRTHNTHARVARYHHLIRTLRCVRFFSLVSWFGWVEWDLCVHASTYSLYYGLMESLPTAKPALPKLVYWELHLYWNVFYKLFFCGNKMFWCDWWWYYDDKRDTATNNYWCYNTSLFSGKDKTWNWRLWLIKCVLKVTL